MVGGSGNVRRISRTYGDYRGVIFHSRDIYVSQRTLLKPIDSPHWDASIGLQKNPIRWIENRIVNEKLQFPIIIFLKKNCMTAATIIIKKREQLVIPSSAETMQNNTRICDFRFNIFRPEHEFYQSCKTYWKNISNPIAPYQWVGSIGLRGTMNENRIVDGKWRTPNHFFLKKDVKTTNASLLTFLALWRVLHIKVARSICAKIKNVCAMLAPLETIKNI